MRPLGLILTTVLVFSTSSAMQPTWLSTPDTSHRCVGDDATFTWEFNSTSEVTTIFFTNAATEKTIATYYYRDGYYKEYDGYTGRTNVPTHTQSTISVVLKAVTKDDTGGYIIELAGPGLRDKAQLIVHEVDDLQPTIKLDNTVIEPNSTINRSRSEDILSVLTSDQLPAKIVIGRDEDDFSHRCTETSSCVCALSPSGQEASTVHIRTRYSMCDPIQISFRIEWIGSEQGDEIEYDEPEKSKAIPIAVCILLLLLICAAAVGVAVAYITIRKKEDSRQTKSDKRFVNFVSRCTRRINRKYRDPTRGTTDPVREHKFADVNDMNETNTNAEDDATLPMLPDECMPKTDKETHPELWKARQPKPHYDDSVTVEHETDPITSTPKRVILNPDDLAEEFRQKMILVDNNERQCPSVDGAVEKDTSLRDECHTSTLSTLNKHNASAADANSGDMESNSSAPADGGTESRPENDQPSTKLTILGESNTQIYDSNSEQRDALLFSLDKLDVNQSLPQPQVNQSKRLSRRSMYAHENN